MNTTLIFNVKAKTGYRNTSLRRGDRIATITIELVEEKFSMWWDAPWDKDEWSSRTPAEIETQNKAQTKLFEHVIRDDIFQGYATVVRIK